MRVLRLASLMSSLEPTTRRSAGALRRLAGGDGADAPAKLAAALNDENWRVQEIEACKDASGKGPLHFAAWRGSPKNCEILIDAGCDVEAPATGEFSYGKTPLFFAVTRCRDATVLALLERGAATKIVNNKGQSVRALARSHLKPETYAAIVAAEEKDTRDWINWRETKSDGLTYGDLDLRFLERPLASTETSASLETTRAAPHCIAPFKAKKDRVNATVHAIDRFWLVNAQGYTTKPSGFLTFTYIDNEWSAAGNVLAEANLGAQRFNDGAGLWGDMWSNGTFPKKKPATSE